MKDLPAGLPALRSSRLPRHLRNFDHKKRQDLEGHDKYVASEDILPGTYLLAVDAAGFQSLHEKIELEDGDCTIAVELVPLSTLIVNVLGPEDVKVPEARVVIDRISMPSRPLVVGSMESEPRLLPGRVTQITNEEGMAVFPDMLPGSSYWLSADALGMCSVRQIPVEIGGIGEESIIDVRLKRASGIIGRVVDVKGGLGEGFEISCRTRAVEQPSQWDWEGETSTDPDGRFWISGLTSGTKRIWGARDREGILETFGLQVELRSGELRDCGDIGPIPVERGGSNIFGTVVDEHGERQPHARVRVVNVSGDHSIRATVHCDESGQFSVVGIPPALYGCLAMSLSDWSIAGHETFSLAPSENKTITLIIAPPQTKTIGIGDAIVEFRGPGDSGLTLEGVDFESAECFLENAEGHWQMFYARRASDVPSGVHYRLTGVPEGVYSLLVIINGLIGRSEQVNIESERTVEVTTILQEAIEISGRIVAEPSGRALRGYVSRLLVTRNLQRTSGLMNTWPVNADTDGRFLVRLFAPGEKGKIVISANGYWSVTLDVSGVNASLGDVALSPQTAHRR